MAQIWRKRDNGNMENLNMPLIDRYGRTIDYLRVSVTDRCDLRCGYCMPKDFKGFEEPADWLRFDEIERIVRAFVHLGTRRVRLTGGEPLTRKNLPDLAANLSAITGLQDLSLSTNGTRLDRYAKDLKLAGVRRLNVSLDSLSQDCVRSITGRDCLDDVLRGLDAARDAGFAPIKINMVVMPEVNADQVRDMVAFCFERGFVLRLIETMPVGQTGRDTGWLPVESVLKPLRQEFDLIAEILPLGGGPARYWRTRDGKGQVGLITPMSQHFCETCNRVRLSVDGTLYLCLGQEDRVSLREPLRNGASDEDLLEIIRQAVWHKPERHDFGRKPEKIVRFMSQTGG